MMFALAVPLAGAVIVLLLVLLVLPWFAARNVEDVVPDLDDIPLPLLPEGHRPPMGLAPISPSERGLSAEVERGLRDLQAFLLDAA